MPDVPGYRTLCHNKRQKIEKQMVDNIKGRKIGDIQYSGLVESLCKISLICHSAGEAKEDLSKQDLMNFLSQIAIIGTEALAFAGATPEEAAQATSYLLSGMRTAREHNN